MKLLRHPLALLAVLILAYFVPRFVQHPDSFLGGYDVEQAQFYYRAYTVNRFRSGALPLWNPHFYCGHPFLANPETNVLYPTTLLFLVLPPTTAFTIDTLVHLVLAAWGMFFFTRHLCGSASAATFAALAYGLSGYMIDRINGGHLAYVHVAALLPWGAYFLAEGMARCRLGCFAMAGIAGAAAVVGGNPQAMYYAALALGIWFLGSLVSLQAGAKWNLLLRRSAGGAISVGVALGLSAVQLAPTLEFVRHSDRSSGSLEFSTFLSFPPANLLTFLVPRLNAPPVDLYCEYSGYVGLLTIGFAAAGVVAGRPRRAVALLVVLALSAASVMLGEHTPLYQWLYKIIPGLGLFRVPARAVAIVNFALCTLSAFGMEAAGRLSSRPRIRLQHAFIAAAVVLLIPALLVSDHGATASVLGLTIPGLLVARYRRHFDGVVVLPLLWLDLLLSLGAGIPLEAVGGTSMVEHPERLQTPTRLESWVDEQEGRFRVRLPHGGARGMAFGYDDVDGYTPLVLDRYFRFMHAMAGVSADPLRRHQLSPAISAEEHDFLGKLLNVRYTVSPSGRFHELGSTLPRAYLVTRSRYIPDLDEHLAALIRGDIELGAEILVNLPTSSEPAADTAEAANTAAAAAADDEVVEILYTPERLVYEIRAPQNCYLFTSELHYPGWTASLDGEQIPISVANFLFRAVQVPAGRHRVIFSYEPAGLWIGGAVTAATLLLLVLLSITGIRGRRLAIAGADVAQ
jgi:hypothetical protein